MIAATIGRTFLNAYNERFEENLSEKDFFNVNVHLLSDSNDKNSFKFAAPGATTDAPYR
jgi:hypothetical protein